jgi:repressor LexA
VAEDGVKGLTTRQRQVLDFMRSFTERHGVPPAVREIGERFGFTARAAFDHLRALEKKGMLERRVTDKRASRTLVVPDRRPPRRPGREEIPVVGRIAAGAPRLAEEQWEDAVPLSPDWLGSQGQDVFALRVKGDSMVQAHIVEGDLVLVRRQDTARTGDVVAALVDNEATVKRFARDGETLILKPEHPTMAPIVVPPGRTDVRILGKVVGVLRRM